MYIARRFGRLLLPIVILLAVTSNARADISGPFATTTPIPATTTDYTGVLSFPKFDSSLGSLLSVELKITSTIITSLHVENTAQSDSSGNVKTEVQVSVWDPANPLAFSLLNDIVTPDQAYVLTAGSSADFNNIQKTRSETGLFSDVTTLAQFNGPGTILLSAGTFTQTLLGNTGGNTSASQVTTADVTGEVTYTYLAVPEPASILLTALGMGSLLLATRRFRR